MNKPPVALVDQSISIDVPAASLFAFLSNHETYIRWYPNVVAIVSANDLPHGAVGKRYRETLRLPSGREQSFNIRVVESRAPDLFITEGTLKPIHPRMEARLTATSARRTLLNLRFLTRSQSALGRLLIPLLFRQTMVRQAQAGLARLKTLVEQTPEHLPPENLPPENLPPENLPPENLPKDRKPPC